MPTDVECCYYQEMFHLEGYYKRMENISGEEAVSRIVMLAQRVFRQSTNARMLKRFNALSRHLSHC